MRIIFVLPVLLLGACQVSKDNANNTITATFNQDVAANAAADVSNTAQNIASDVGNEAKSTGAKIENKVDNANISVKVDKDVKTENKQ